MSRSTGSRCAVFSSCGTRAQWLWRMGLVAPRHVGSSRTRARTRVPCVGRWIPLHHQGSPHGADSCAVPMALFCLTKSSCSLSFFPRFSITNALVRSGSCNRIPQTGWLNDNNLFLIVLEAGSLRSGCQCGEGSLAGLRTAVFSSHSHLMRAEREEATSLGSLLIRVLIPFMGSC